MCGSFPHYHISHFVPSSLRDPIFGPRLHHLSFASHVCRVVSSQRDWLLPFSIAYHLIFPSSQLRHVIPCWVSLVLIISKVSLFLVTCVVSCRAVSSQGDCRVIALSETTREQVVQSINLFLASMIYRVLIVSYEVSSERAPIALPPRSR